MKRLVPVAIALAIVAVLVSIKVRSRTAGEALGPGGTWELADGDAPATTDPADDAS